ncbi:MAG: S-layer homology domain-containing protein [Candidatus Electrothrix sp. AX2]|nr:S-layer homology domain-containing protein [Candidatus Electrothrix gigas]
MIKSRMSNIFLRQLLGTKKIYLALRKKVTLKWDNVWLQNFQVKDVGEKSAIFIDREHSKTAYLVKGAFWKWYSSLNGPTELGYPVTNEFEPNEICLTCSIDMFTSITTKGSMFSSGTTYEILSRQDFENGVLLWGKSGNKYKILKISSSEEDKVYIYDDPVNHKSEGKSKEYTKGDGVPYEKSVRYLYENEITTGYDDGFFRPDNSISRAEILALVLRALSKKETTIFKSEGCEENCTDDSQECRKKCLVAEEKCEQTGYPDVEKKSWYCPYVKYATDRGIVHGYVDDGKFRPATNVT